MVANDIGFEDPSAGTGTEPVYKSWKSLLEKLILEQSSAIVNQVKNQSYFLES